MVLLLIKILISLAFGAFAAMASLNNFQDAPANLAYVESVISMIDVFPTSPKARAIFPLESAQVFLSIILAIEGFIAFLLIIGSFRMLANIGKSAKVFSRSKIMVSLGYCTAILLWFLGFVVFGGEWFLAWQSPLGNSAVETSYNISIIAFLALIFVSLKDEELK